MSVVFLSYNQPRDQKEKSDFIGFIGLHTWASGSYKHEYCQGSPVCMSCVCRIQDCLDSGLLMRVTPRGPCLHILYTITWPTGGLLTLVIDDLFVHASSPSWFQTLSHI